MSEIIRTEEWTQEGEWGISTLVVNVFKGEKVGAQTVQVSADLLEEFELDTKLEMDSLRTPNNILIHVFPYEVVALQLQRTGWVKKEDADGNPS